MSQLAVQIENRLHSAGYKTERIGGEVQAFDPVYKSLPGSSELVLDHHKLVEVRSLSQAWAFIEERA
jgi:hypothetical protein